MPGLIEKIRKTDKEPYAETFEGFCQAKLATDQWTKEQKHFMAKLFYQYNENKRRGQCQK